MINWSASLQLFYQFMQVSAGGMCLRFLIVGLSFLLQVSSKSKFKQFYVFFLSSFLLHLFRWPLMKNLSFTSMTFTSGRMVLIGIVVMQHNIKRNVHLNFVLFFLLFGFAQPLRWEFSEGIMSHKLWAYWIWNVLVWGSLFSIIFLWLKPIALANG